MIQPMIISWIVHIHQETLERRDNMIQPLSSPGLCIYIKKHLRDEDNVIQPAIVSWIVHIHQETLERRDNMVQPVIIYWIVHIH